MKSESTTIYKDTCNLIRLLRQCVPMLGKAERIAYLTPASEWATKTHGLFNVAYDSEFGESQYRAFREFRAAWAGTLAYCRILIEMGGLHTAGGIRRDTMITWLIECLGNIDTAISKWGRKLSKPPGKTGEGDSPADEPGAKGAALPALENKGGAVS